MPPENYRLKQSQSYRVGSKCFFPQRSKNVSSLPNGSSTCTQCQGHSSARWENTISKDSPSAKLKLEIPNVLCSIFPSFSFIPNKTSFCIRQEFSGQIFVLLGVQSRVLNQPVQDCHNCAIKSFCASSVLDHHTDVRWLTDMHWLREAGFSLRSAVEQ